MCTNFCTIVALQARFFDSSHQVAVKHPSWISPLPSIFPECVRTGVIVYSSSVSINAMICRFNRYFLAFTKLSRRLYFFSLVDLDPRDVHDSHLRFATQATSLQKLRLSRSYRGWLHSPVTRFSCQIINVISSFVSLSSRRGCLSIVTFVVSSSMSSSRFCFWTSFTTLPCRLRYRRCCQYTVVLSHSCYHDCHKSFVPFFVDLLRVRFRSRIVAVGVGEGVFCLCQRMTVWCGMLKTDDDDVIGYGGNDVLLQSGMTCHGVHALHAVRLLRYWAFIFDASNLESVLALCAAWAGCLPCPPFRGWGLGWSSSIEFIIVVWGVLRTLL